MTLHSLKIFLVSLISVIFITACGGDSAPAPTGLTARAGESSVTVTWDMAPGVEYWLFYGPSSAVPASTDNMKGWIGVAGGASYMRVTSPYLVTGLVNGTSYSFSVNGRTGGGPGGPGATPVSVAPRIAGTSWTPGSTASTFGSDLRAVVFGTTSSTATPASTATYLAAGSGGAMYSSVDGASWTPLNYTSNTNALFGAAYLANSYTLVGQGGVILTSSDLSTWTSPTTNPALTSGATLYAVANNRSNLMVAVGAGGLIMTSADGITWTSRTSPVSQDLYAVTYSTFNQGSNTLGTWLAVGAAGTLVQSVDAGVTWTAVNLASVTTQSLRGVAYGASTSTAGVVTPAFVAVGDGGTVLTSADGLTWKAQTLPGAPTLHAVLATETLGSLLPTVVTQYVAVGEGGALLTSTDGVTWGNATVTPANSKTLYAITRNTSAGKLGYTAVGAAGTNLSAQ